jgi:hypothetical protein
VSVQVKLLLRHVGTYSGGGKWVGHIGLGNGWQSYWERQVGRVAGWNYGASGSWGGVEGGTARIALNCK